MAVGDLFRVTVVQTLHGQTCMSVLHYEEAATGAGNASQLLGGIIDGLVAGGLIPLMSTQWTYSGTVVQKFFPLPALISVIVNVGTGPGTDAAVSVPVQVAAVIRKRSPYAGRKERGRIFQCGVPEDKHVESVLTTAYRTALTTAWEAIHDTHSSGTYSWVPVIYHRSSNTTTDISNFVTDPILRSQRRREVGVGQ